MTFLNWTIRNISDIAYSQHTRFALVINAASDLNNKMVSYFLRCTS